MEKIMATLYYVRKGKKELQIQVLGIGIHFSKVKGIWLCLIVKEKLHLSEALWIWERSLRAVWRETLNWANFRNNLVKHSRKYGTRLFFFWFKTVLLTKDVWYFLKYCKVILLFSSHSTMVPPYYTYYCRWYIPPYYLYYSQILLDICLSQRLCDL